MGFTLFFDSASQMVGGLAAVTAGRLLTAFRAPTQTVTQTTNGADGNNGHDLRVSVIFPRGKGRKALKMPASYARAQLITRRS